MKHFVYNSIKICLVLAFLPAFLAAQNSSTADHPLTLGAYYFDGWTAGSNHLTAPLLRDYVDREPIWGWVTSKPDIMRQQIDVAADAGLSFFSFDWYAIGKDSQLPTNNALGLYLQAPNRSRLHFCLLVANHPPYLAGPDNWDFLTTEWIKLFKDPAYLVVNKKPLLIFFSVPTLVKTFGSPKAVREALASFRKKARQGGLPGVTIAACVYASQDGLRTADQCGFDLFTGYNYHGNALTGRQQEVPVDSMLAADQRVWNTIAARSSTPYAPAATLNWDPRPWRDHPDTIPHLTGYSCASVFNDVQALKTWTAAHSYKHYHSAIALLYAWNENGEGGWLTPSKARGDSLLQGVKNALHTTGK